MSSENVESLRVSLSSMLARYNQKVATLNKEGSLQDIQELQIRDKSGAPFKLKDVAKISKKDSNVIFVDLLDNKMSSTVMSHIRQTYPEYEIKLDQGLIGVRITSNTALATNIKKLQVNYIEQARKIRRDFLKQCKQNLNEDQRLEDELAAEKLFKDYVSSIEKSRAT